MSSEGRSGGKGRNRAPSAPSEPGFPTPHAALAAEAEFQWGLFTAAQAERVGVSRKNLVGLVDRGHVEHSGVRGVYRFAGTPIEAILYETRCSWLALFPDLFMRERLKALRVEDNWDDAIVSHLTAANYVYGLGNCQPEHFDFTVKAWRRTRDLAVEFYPSEDKPQWASVDGLPVTTVAQTIADLYADQLDQGHLGEILYDALLHRGENLREISDSLDSVTDGQGRATALRLLEIANAPADIVTANELIHGH
jgi:hypothetical protein